MNQVIGVGKPPIRADGLEIQEAGDGFIVYQAERDRIHYLNHTATLVLEACVGELEADGIAGLVARAFSLRETPVEDVEAVLRDLADEGLISWGGSDEAIEAPTTRPESTTA